MCISHNLIEEILHFGMLLKGCFCMWCLDFLGGFASMGHDSSFQYRLLGIQDHLSTLRTAEMAHSMYISHNLSEEFLHFGMHSQGYLCVWCLDFLGGCASMRHDSSFKYRCLYIKDHISTLKTEGRAHNIYISHNLIKDFLAFWMHSKLCFPMSCWDFYPFCACIQVF